jgi:cathepsin L
VAPPQLSEQQLVSCAGPAYGNYGCQGGYIASAYKYVYEHPLTTTAQYPYVSGNGAVPACNVAVQNTGQYSITAYRTIPPGSCDSLKNALASMPISVCVDAANWQNYNSGIFSACGT